MKGMILLLLVLAIPLAVSAQSWIGIFDNAEGVAICHADIQLGVPQALYLMAVLAPAEFPDGITAAEFRVDNLPPNDCAEGGIITENWSSEVVVGDLDWDFSIAWPTPQLAPQVLIGELEFLMLDSHGSATTMSWKSWPATPASAWSSWTTSSWPGMSSVASSPGTAQGSVSASGSLPPRKAPGPR